MSRMLNACGQSRANCIDSRRARWNWAIIGILLLVLLGITAPVSGQSIDLGIGWLPRDLDNLDAYPCVRMVVNKITGSSIASQELKDHLATHYNSEQLEGNSLPYQDTDELLQLYGIGVYFHAPTSDDFSDQLRGSINAGMPAILGTSYTFNRQFVVNGYEIQGGVLQFRIQDPAEPSSIHAGHPAGYLVRFDGNQMIDEHGIFTQITSALFIAPSFQFNLANKGSITFDVKNRTMNPSQSGMNSILMAVAPYCGNNETVDFDVVRDATEQERIMPMILTEGRSKDNYWGVLKVRVDVPVGQWSPVILALTRDNRIETDRAKIKELMNYLSLRRYAQSVDGTRFLGRMSQDEYDGIWGTYNDPTLLPYHLLEPEKVVMYRTILRDLMYARIPSYDDYTSVSDELYDIIQSEAEAAEVFGNYDAIRPIIQMRILQDFQAGGLSFGEYQSMMEQEDTFAGSVEALGNVLTVLDFASDIFRGLTNASIPLVAVKGALSDMRAIRPHLISSELQSAADDIIDELEASKSNFESRFVDYLSSSTREKLIEFSSRYLLDQAFSALASGGTQLAWVSSAGSIFVAGYFLGATLANLPEVSEEIQLAAYGSNIARELYTVTFSNIQQSIASSESPENHLLRAYSAGFSMLLATERYSFAHTANALDAYEYPPGHFSLLGPSYDDQQQAIAYFRNRSNQHLETLSFWKNPWGVEAAMHGGTGRMWVYAPTQHPYHFGSQPPIPQKPSAPHGLVFSPGDNRVSIQWEFNSASDNVSKYIVYRATSPNADLSSYTKLKEVNSTTSFYVDQTAANGTTYYYRMTASNSVGESSPTAPFASTPQAWVCQVRLLGPAVEPTGGSTSTNFELKVIYDNYGNHPPTKINAVITPAGGATMRRQLLRRDNVGFPQGSLYSAWGMFSSGTYNVYFEANDGYCTPSDVTSSPITFTVSGVSQSQLYLANLSVAPTFYSPNGDGIQDNVAVSYTIGGSFTRLGRIEVYDAAGHLANSPYAWDWKQPGTYQTSIGPSILDGTYKVKAWATNFGTFLEQRSTLDGYQASDIAIAPNGDIYVVITGNRIDRFSSSLNYLGSVGGVPNQQPTSLFQYPWGLHVDGTGNVLVAETGPCRITKITPSGSVLLRFGSCGSASNQLYLPSDVVTDESGNIYVLDSGNRKVKKFTSSGGFLLESQFSLISSNQYNFHKLIYDGNGHLYVSDYGRVLRLNTSLVMEREFATAGLVGNSPVLPGGIAIDKDGNLIVATSGGSNEQCLKFDVTSGALLDYAYGYGYAQGGGGGFAGTNGIIVLPSGDLLTAFGGSGGTMRKFTNSNPAIAATSDLVCDLTSPSLDISFPGAQATVSGTVPIQGTASDQNFSSLSLYYRNQSATHRITIVTSQAPVDGGQIGFWNTEGLASGDYFIILVVSDRAGNSSADSVLVHVNPGEGNSNLTFCENFDDAGNWQSRWVRWYGTQELVSSPSHSGSAAVRFYGDEGGCGTSVWRTNFQASNGEYSFWFRHENYEAEPRIYVMVDPNNNSVDPVYREGYMLALGAADGHPASRYIRVAHVTNPATGDFLTSDTPTQFPMNTWVRGYIRIEGGGRIIAGYEWSGGSDEVVCYDPNPITRSGLFMLFTCADGPASSNVYDDVCFQELAQPSSEPFCDNLDDGSGWLSRWTPFHSTPIPTIVDSPTHSDGQAVRFETCWPAMYRTGLEAVEGVYSGWVYQTNTNQQGAEFVIQSDFDGTNWMGSRYYDLDFSALGTPGGGFMRLTRRENAAQTSYSSKPVTFERNEWVQIFIERRLPDTVIAGYQRTNGFRDSMLFIDPNPLMSPGKFIIMSCGQNASNAYIWDDICYTPTTSQPPLPEANHDPAIFGEGHCFNGTDHYIQVANSSSLDLGNSYTIDAWINLDDLPSSIVPEYAIVSKWLGTSSGGYMFGVAGPGNLGKLAFNAGYGISAFSSTSLQTNQWYHVAVTYDGQYIQFFINGIADPPIAAPGGSSENSGSLAIGKNIHNNYDSSVNPYHFKGRIDEVRISSVVRTPQEFALTAPSLAGPNTSALWHLNESGASPATDASSNGNVGTVFGNQCAPPQVNHDNSAFAASRCFNGSDDYISVPNAALNNLSSGTVEAWVKFKSLDSPGAGEQFIVFRGKQLNVDYVGDLRLAKELSEGSDADKFYFSLNNGVTRLYSSTVAEIDTWYHVAGTWNGSQWHIFVNGIDEGFVSESAVLSNDPMMEVRLGRGYGVSIQYEAPFNGEMDEVRISSIVRSPHEFALTAPSAPDANTAALWHLDDGSGVDASSNGNTGTFHGTGCFGSTAVSYTTFWTNQILQLHAWEGTKVSVLSRSVSLDPQTMHSIVGAFDDAYSYYQLINGREPTPYAPTYLNGRSTIADVPLTCGAGCAEVGYTGIEIESSYFDQLYHDVLQSNKFERLVFYEFSRNFWFYDDKINYKEPDARGHIAGGYGVYMLFKSMEAAGVEGADYKGQPFSYFKSEVLGLIDRYLNNASLNWENTLKINQVPDNPMGLTGADLFASFIFRLERDYGGDGFAETIWKEVAKRPSAATTQDAVDNFVLAACAAVNENLVPVFLSWRWPVSQKAQAEASLIGKPLWRFSMIVGISSATAAHYGGFAQTRLLVLEQIQTVNERFNSDNRFHGKFDFNVASIYEFSGSAESEVVKPHEGFSYRLVYDGYPQSGGGWYGPPNNAIRHAWGVTNDGGPFGGHATDGLVHEFGHSRGAIDLYAIAVQSDKNPINGTPFEPPTSIMNYPYDITAWDEHSIALINQNENNVYTSSNYLTTSFPSVIGAIAYDVNGDRLPKVSIKSYPVEWYRFSVAANPLMAAVTNSEGVFNFSVNPFGPGQANHPWDIVYPNFLVTAEIGGVVKFAWLPITDVQNSFFTDPEAAFRLSFSFPFSTARSSLLPSAWFSSWAQSNTGTIRAYIGNIPTGHNASNIVPSSIRLNGQLPVLNGQSRVRPSMAGFTGSVLEVAFNRQLAVQSLPQPLTNGTHTVLITGDFTDGKKFIAAVDITLTGAAAKELAGGEVEDEQAEILPTDFYLGDAHPNPFNPSTTIDFGLPQPAHVEIEVINMLGQKVRTLADGEFVAGSHSVNWDGISDTGVPVASGVYLYRIKAGEFTQTKKMVLMK